MPHSFSMSGLHLSLNSHEIKERCTNLSKLVYLSGPAIKLEESSGTVNQRKNLSVTTVWAQNSVLTGKEHILVKIIQTKSTKPSVHPPSTLCHHH